MKQEDKELLLKDLCARLPYGAKVNAANKYISTISSINIGITTLILLKDVSPVFGIEDIKPYLRPMSSMTEEEFKEYHSMLIDVENSGLMNQKLITKIVDWLDKKMFDHRGLIPKGLALEASEGMYN